MPRPTFVLKEPSSMQPTLIYLFYRFRGQKLKYSTGQKIHPKFWNEVSQTVKETRQFPHYSEFNALLLKLGTEVENHHRKLINDGISPTPELLRKHLDTVIFRNIEQPSKQKTLFEFIQNLIDESARNINTIKQYKLAFNNLKEYAALIKQEISFEDIDLEFHNGFIKFLQEKEYSTNTIGARIKNIKVFMGEAFERGLTKNVEYKNRKFAKPAEKSESIYLTLEEVEKIVNLDLSKNERLDKVRDLFIIGCYTGLRFSDLVQLRDGNLIDNKSKIRIKTFKTGEVVVIPLHKNVRSVLSKYDGIPLQSISNQKMNEYIKELGQLAEINEPVMIAMTKGGKKQTETFLKHQLITVHTARRSFATNAYLNDIPSISIMKITGHSTERAFLTYIKISQEDNANKLLNHPFFS